MVQALLVVDGDVYVGGNFKDAAGIASADHIAKLEIASSHRADARIRKGSGPLRGNNIYNADAANQILTASKRRGESVTFTISIQNDGTVSERYAVRATGSSTTMYTVTYLRGATDITSAIVGGTYRTPPLSPGGEGRHHRHGEGQVNRAPWIDCDAAGDSHIECGRRQRRCREVRRPARLVLHGRQAPGVPPAGIGAVWRGARPEWTVHAPAYQRLIRPHPR